MIAKYTDSIKSKTLQEAIRSLHAEISRKESWRKESAFGKASVHFRRALEQDIKNLQRLHALQETGELYTPPLDKRSRVFTKLKG